MSRMLPLIVGARASSAVTDAASKVLSSVGVSLKAMPLASTSSSDIKAAVSGNAGVALASPLAKSEVNSLSQKLGSALHTTSIDTTPSASMNPDPIFADASYTVVRSNDADMVPQAISSLERVDRFPKQGIPTTQEQEYLKESFTKTAKAAVALAKSRKTKITVMLKPQSSISESNKLFYETVREVADEEDVSVDQVTTQQATNTAIMFSKTLGVVLAPDHESSDIFEDVTIGIAGGLGMVSEKHIGNDATVFAAAHGNPPAKTDAGVNNPTGLLLAAAGALAKMGMTAESEKVLAALKKAYGGKVLPADVKGGSADAATFGAEIAKSI